MELINTEENLASTVYLFKKILLNFLEDLAKI